MVKNLLLLLQIYVTEYSDENVKLPKEIEEILSCTMLFSTVWSIGASMEETCRKKFNEFLLKLISAAPDIPDQFNLDLSY